MSRWVLALLLAVAPDLGRAAIALQQTVTGSGTSTTITLPSISGGTSQTYVLFIATEDRKKISSVSGSGLTWTQRSDQCSHNDTGASIWTAQGSPASSFQLSISLSQSKQVVAVLSRYTGVASFSGAAGENTRGPNGNCGSAPQTSAPQLTLTSAVNASVHVLAVGVPDTTVTSASASYAALGNASLAAIRIWAYAKAMPTAGADTFGATLSAADNWAVVGLVLEPAVAGPDHFSISHDGSALNCQAEPVTLTAHDASHNVYPGYTGTITLSTSTGHGDWALVTGSGTLTNSGSGSATYIFAVADLGIVALSLRDSFSESADIDVNAGSVLESALEDPVLSFASTGFVFLAGGSASAIGTQIGGKGSDIAPGAQVLELQAVRTSDQTGACEAALVGANAVELAFECRNPASCGTRQVAINGTAIAANDSGSVASYTAVSLDFGDATDTTATFMLSYPDIGRLRLHARYTLSPSGEVLSGASNEFAVRPFAFQVVVPSNPAASIATGSVFTSAGTPFQVDMEAVLWSGADDANLDGVADGHADTDPSNGANLADNTGAPSYGRESAVEAVSLLAALWAPSGGTDPGLAGTTSIASFSSGAGTSGGARWDEVGIAELRAVVGDGDYLGIGAAETAKIAGRSGYVGRFVPHHFGIATNLPQLQTGCAAGSFSYLQQPFGYVAGNEPVITATAVSALDTVTQNYTGSYFRLTNASLSGRSYTAAAGTLDLSGLPATTTDPAIADAGVGVGTLTFSSGSGLTFSRSVLAAPFDAEISLSLDVSDLDTVTPASNPVTFGAASAGNGIAFSAGKQLRFGRAVLTSAHGSELLPLAVPLRAEYWTGNGFALNAVDACTAVPVAELALAPSPPPLSTIPSLTSPFAVGDAGLSLSAPGSSGYFDLLLDLSSATGAAAPWLRYDWPFDGNSDGSYDDDPQARATFGIYAGDAPLVYVREVY